MKEESAFMTRASVTRQLARRYIVYQDAMDKTTPTRPVLIDFATETFEPLQAESVGFQTVLPV